MVLLEELHIALGVGANGLGKTNGDGMQEVEVDGGIVLEFATNDWVIAPLDLDEVGDALTPILSGDL